MKHNFIFHLHPKKIRESSIRFNLTFGLGGMAAFLFVIQVFSGLLLKYHYQPNPANAYDSILYINNGLIFGKLVRNIHHWSAIIMILIAFLHMMRVVLTEAFYNKRKNSWFTGISMLIIIILFNFTGYLLPWDQLSYWAITISAGLIEYIPGAGTILRKAIVGGCDINEITLSNFYHLHTGFLPLILLILAIWHFWKIRKAGGVIMSKTDNNSKMIDTVPHLIKREAIVALALTAFILLMSIFIDAPLHERANPIESPNPAKAPWYFLGFQEILLHFNPFIATALLPLLLLLFIIYMPLSKNDSNTTGLWFGFEHSKKLFIVTMPISIFGTILFVLVSELFAPQSLFPSISPIIATGLIPLVFISIIMLILLKAAKKYLAPSKTQIIQSVFILLSLSYITFTAIGIFFRGEGMELMWP